MKGSVRRGCVLLVLMLFFVILVTPATAYTTEVTVRRYASDGLTPINETTKTYQWMRDNLPVYGDGNTYYYFQGPIFEGEWETNYGVTFPEYRTNWGGTPPDWFNSSEIWDRYWNGTAYEQMEKTNWQGKNLGKLKGTNIKDLCNLVGGLPPGKVAKVIATDNVDQSVPYSVLYTPTDKLGPFVLTWWSVDAGESGGTNGYTGPDYMTGMRTTFFSDTSRNPNGSHVAGLGDQAEGIPQEYWYKYGGQYPSMGGWTLKYVDRVYVYSNDPVPLPVADFIANTKTGLIVNGNFETGTTLSPWTSNGGATRHTGSATYRHGNASAKLAATVGTPAWIQQNVDLTNVGSINIWRYSFGGAGKYMEVLVDGIIVANFTETGTVTGKYETIDISSYGLTGTHTLKFNAVNAASLTFTVYLDDIEDYGPGTSGNAPLSVQFKDLSTYMQDPAHTSWAWDFYNNGTSTSTQRNPSFVYTANGTYTVKLTATNAGGSDAEIKTGYITVGTVMPPPVANFTATPKTGTALLTVQFNDTSTNTPTAWRWAYRNTTVGWTQFATTQNSSYTFPAGTYDINLTATNAAGSDDEIKTGYITVNEAVVTPVADFIAMPLSGTAPLTVQFNDTSTNTPTSWRWAFKNATVSWTQFSTLKNPSYTFAAGTYDINLTATNAAGSDDEIKTGYITVSEAVVTPVANFTATPKTGTAPHTVQFNDTSTNSPTSWNWAYKNSTSGWTQFATSQNTSYTFAAGTYDINLTATNSAGSDDEVKTEYIVVNAPSPVADFTALPLSGIAPLIIQFTDTSTNTPTSWNWAYKNDTVSWTQFATSQNPSFTFAAGTYDINLTVTNSGGSDDEIKEGYIALTEPPYIDIDLIGSISNWGFSTGTNDDTSSVDLRVETNMDSWTVAARDALDGGKPSGTAGRMAEWSGVGYVPSGKVLTDAMQVRARDGSFIAISGSDQDIITVDPPGTIDYDMTMRQVIELTDPALEGSHSYRIVITFTGSAA